VTRRSIRQPPGTLARRQTFRHPALRSSGILRACWGSSVRLRSPATPCARAARSIRSSSPTWPGRSSRASAPSCPAIGHRSSRPWETRCSSASRPPSGRCAWPRARWESSERVTARSECASACTPTPAVERDGDWFGATVNVAARVAAEADADEVLLTRATLDAARPVSADDEHVIEAVGERRLKNVSRPVELHALRVPALRRGRMATDPVCRMALAAEVAHTSRRHGDASVLLCSALRRGLRSRPVALHGRLRIRPV